jgi:hypothetical protein
MLIRFLVSFLLAAGLILSAQGQPKIIQPTLTPQNSGTMNGLIAVSPGIRRSFELPYGMAHSRSQPMVETPGKPAWFRAPKCFNFAM